MFCKSYFLELKLIKSHLEFNTPYIAAQGSTWKEWCKSQERQRNAPPRPPPRSSSRPRSDFSDTSDGSRNLIQERQRAENEARNAGAHQSTQQGRRGRSRSRSRERKGN